jgi:hypothetical protein
LLYAPDFELPEREQLGDTDRTKWVIGKFSGEPMTRREDDVGPQATIHHGAPHVRTLDKTGWRAVATLLKHYDRLQVSSPGSFLVVRLRSGATAIAALAGCSRLTSSSSEHSAAHRSYPQYFAQ